jgi:hypothetical protein
MLPLGFSGSAVTFGGKSLYFGTPSGALAVAMENGSTWTTQPIDDGRSFAPPTGLPYLMTPGFLATSTAVSKTGIVLAGDATYSDVSATTERHTTRESALWYSSDATHWTRFDPRTLLGGIGESVTISDVVVDKSGFMAVGSVAAATNLDKPQIFVLRSGDGQTWTLASKIASTWSADSDSVMQFKGGLLLSGWEYACTVDAGTHSSFSVGAQLRMWQSADDGSTWTAVSLAGAEPVIHVPTPAPADASTCPKASDLQTIETRYTSTGRIVGVYDDHLVVDSKDEVTTAVTADLTTWKTATLPDRQPAGGRTTSLTRMITAGPDGWIYRSFEQLRDAQDQVAKVGYQVRWWRSTDAGTTWTAGTPGKPMIAGGAFYTLAPQADGSIQLVTAPTSASGIAAQTAVQLSVAGPAVDWTHCVAAPKADCTFATVVTAAPGTKDLRGIDLAAATFTGASLPGVDLTGARLYSATLGGDFTGANLSNVNLSGASLTGTFDGANFSGTELSSATLAGSMTGANFAGAFMAEAAIGARLNNATFKGARLDGAIFSGADLTGGDFTGVTAAGVVFDKATVTCPDGKPSNPAGKGLAACRIKP